MTALLAAAQFASPPGEVTANTARAVAAVRAASQQGAVLVVLPEYGISGYHPRWVRDGAPGGAEQVPGPALTAIAQESRERGITVVLSDLARADGKLRSVSVIVAEGEVLTQHTKTIVTEGEAAAGLVPGDSPATPVRVPGIAVPVAPLICFEHGFPEIALDLALAGAGLIAVSSAIGTGHEYLRNLRTRARAQDNGCYVVAANAVGGDFCGESMIVDPRGEVVARAGREPAIITAALDPTLIASQRQAEPVLRLRRPELRRPELRRPELRRDRRETDPADR